jgi:hypothetical protein
MMFVHTNAVESHLIGMLEFIQIFVIDPVAFFRLVQVTGNINPHAAVLLLKILWQVRAGHEMEPAHFHEYYSCMSTSLVLGHAHGGPDCTSVKPMLQHKVHAGGCQPGGAIEERGIARNELFSFDVGLAWVEVGLASDRQRTARALYA